MRLKNNTRINQITFPENNEYLVAARAMVRYQKGEYRELFSILEENNVSLFAWFLIVLNVFKAELARFHFHFHFLTVLPSVR